MGRAPDAPSRLIAQHRVMSGYHAWKRWLYRDDRPHGFASMANRVQAVLASAGLPPKRLVTLEVRGRRSGRTRSFPVVVADYQAERYLVAMLGNEANWIRNARAAGGNVVLHHGRREAVHLEDVEPGARAPIIKRYLEVAPGARPHIPVDRRAPLADFEEIARQIPVFRVGAAYTAART
jgi:deazaflavin-dependent oxidoreductase (nitroreductase family)